MMQRGDVTRHILRLWPKNVEPPGPSELRQMSHEFLLGKSQEALSAVRVSIADLAIDLPQLAEVDLPILALIGTEDPYLSDVRALKAIRPATNIVEIAGASHDSAPAQPVFSQALVNFIKAHE